MSGIRISSFCSSIDQAHSHQQRLVDELQFFSSVTNVKCVYNEVAIIVIYIATGMVLQNLKTIKKWHACIMEMLYIIIC